MCVHIQCTHVCPVLFMDNAAYKLFGCTNANTPSKLTLLHVIIHLIMDTAHSLILFIMQIGLERFALDVAGAIHEYCSLI